MGYYIVAPFTCSIAGQARKFLPGTSVQDANTITSLQAAGASLWPDTDAIVAAAAIRCQTYSKLRGANEDELARVMRSAIDANMSFVPITFGDGRDGIAVLDGTTSYASFASLANSVYTLTRDVFLAAGTILKGVTLAAAGFRIFVAGKLWVQIGATISCDGNAAVGITIGAQSALGSLGVGTAGGLGRANNTGVAGSAQTNGLGDATASGGAGGAGGANAGGAGGAYAIASSASGGANYLTAMLSGFIAGQTSGGNQALTSIIGGGAGGGGGGSDNIAAIPGSGGGAAGAVVIAAFNLQNDGTIRANGGAGGNASGSGGNAGGGGGGGGGIITSISRFRSGVGAMLATGGSGGTPLGTGVAGTKGNDGHINQDAA